MTQANLPVPTEAQFPVSRVVALMPVWLVLRLLALGLPRPHSLRRLSLRAFVIHARERAFWLGVALYAGIALWLRVLSAMVPALREALPLGP